MTLEWKRRLEEWMGIAPSAPGEDTQWAWRFHLGWPDWALALFVVAAVAYVLFVYLREGQAGRPAKLFLAGLRLAAIALIVLMLGELEIAVERTGLPHLVFAIDDSESQGLRDGAAASPGVPAAPAASRLQRGLDWLTKDDGRRLAGLLPHYKLRFAAVGPSLRRLGEDAIKDADLPGPLAALKALQPTGRESLLGQHVRETLNDLRGAPPAGVVMLTDGATTRGETLKAVAAFAARRQTPLYFVGIGDPEAPRDLEIGDVLAEDTVFLGDEIAFETTLTGRGLQGQEVPVRLTGEGIPTPIETKVRVGADGQPVKVRLVFRPDKATQKTGSFQYAIDTPVLDRELAKDNNRVERPVAVIDEKVKALLVDSEPRYEYRFLKTLLERQGAVDLRTLLLDADPEYLQEDRSALGHFPERLEELKKFDVVLLGDVKPALLGASAAADLADFVKQGGGLAFLAGPENDPNQYKGTPLEDVLPIKLGGALASARRVAEEGFQARLTTEGMLHPIMRLGGTDEENLAAWQGLQPLFWHVPADQLKPAAQALLEHPARSANGRQIALVATQFFGGGRVLYHGFDGTWRWRHLVEDLHHSRYWTQAVRYLSRTKLLGAGRLAELSADRNKYRRGAPVRFRVRFVHEAKAPRPGEALAVVVERQGERPERTKVELQTAPGRRDSFEGMLPGLGDGQYLAKLELPGADGGAQPMRFSVLPPPGELDHTRLLEDELKEAAKISGGKYWRLAEADQLFDPGALPRGRRVAVTNDQPYPLWRSWPMLALFVGLLTVEWLLRKRWKMV